MIKYFIYGNRNPLQAVTFEDLFCLCIICYICCRATFYCIQFSPLCPLIHDVPQSFMFANPFITPNLANSSRLTPRRRVVDAHTSVLYCISRKHHIRDPNGFLFCASTQLTPFASVPSKLNAFPYISTLDEYPLPCIFSRVPITLISCEGRTNKLEKSRTHWKWKVLCRIVEKFECVSPKYYPPHRYLSGVCVKIIHHVKSNAPWRVQLAGRLRHPHVLFICNRRPFQTHSAHF